MSDCAGDGHGTARFRDPLRLLARDQSVDDERLPGILDVLQRLGTAVTLPPHAHPRGYEWSLDPERAATVTVDRADGPLHAAQIANEETSGLAASIATQDPVAAMQFIDACTGAGVFWNSTTRLLDGSKLLRLPETGINIDRVPGPWAGDVPRPVLAAVPGRAQ